MSSPKIVEVVAAVIEKDGLILIGQRRPQGKHALKWEFPGGKVEPGETAPQALGRELREELGIDAEIGEEIARYDFHYAPEVTTRLVFFQVPRFSGEVRNLAFHQIDWERREALPARDFLEGDVDFVRWLAEGPAGLKR